MKNESYFLLTAEINNEITESEIILREDGSFSNEDTEIIALHAQIMIYNKQNTLIKKKKRSGFHIFAGLCLYEDLVKSYKNENSHPNDFLKSTIKSEVKKSKKNKWI